MSGIAGNRPRKVLNYAVLAKKGLVKQHALQERVVKTSESDLSDSSFEKSSFDDVLVDHEPQKPRGRQKRIKIVPAKKIIGSSTFSGRKNVAGTTTKLHAKAIDAVSNIKEAFSISEVALNNFCRKASDFTLPEEWQQTSSEPSVEGSEFMVLDDDFRKFFARVTLMAAMQTAKLLNPTTYKKYFGHMDFEIDPNSKLHAFAKSIVEQEQNKNLLNVNQEGNVQDVASSSGQIKMKKPKTSMQGSEVSTSNAPSKILIKKRRGRPPTKTDESSDAPVVKEKKFLSVCLQPRTVSDQNDSSDSKETEVVSKRQRVESGFYRNLLGSSKSSDKSQSGSDCY